MLTMMMIQMSDEQKAIKLKILKNLVYLLLARNMSLLILFLLQMVITQTKGAHQVGGTRVWSTVRASTRVVEQAWPTSTNIQPTTPT